MHNQLTRMLDDLPIVNYLCPACIYGINSNIQFVHLL